MGLLDGWFGEWDTVLMPWVVAVEIWKLIWEDIPYIEIGAEGFIGAVL